MAASPPEPEFSSSDKKLLILMGRLLLEYVDQEASNSNLPVGKVTLTDSEAAELMERLEELASSRQFLESAYFVEGITSPDAREETRVREIYLSGRRKRGRSRLMSTAEWLDFKARMGISQEVYSGRKQTTPMSFTYFQKLERRLLSAAGLDKRVIDVVMGIVVSQHQQVERLRKRQLTLRHGIIRSIVLASLFRWRDQIREREFSSNKMAAAITVVTDTSILFTTRDWNVVGTLSTIAAASVVVASVD